MQLPPACRLIVSASSWFARSRPHVHAGVYVYMSAEQVAVIRQNAFSRPDSADWARPPRECDRVALR